MAREADDDWEADIRATLEGPSEEQPAPVQPEEQQQAAPERPRDEHGRFKPVDKAEEAEEVEAAPAEEPDKPTILPPRSWTAAAKAKFALLDPDIQQEVLRREKEIDDGKAQWDTKAEQFNRLQKLFDPVRDQLTLSGLDEAAYIRALVQADMMLKRNPQQGLMEVARMYGVQLPQGAQPANGYQQPAIDPTIQALLQKVGGLEQSLQGWQSQAEERERAQINGEIEAFRSDPANIYFDNVRDKMVQLLEARLAADLPSAYRMACQLDDDVQKAMTIKPVTPGKPAKPKDISVTGGKGQGSAQKTSNPRNSEEDDVRAALEELSGRL